MPLPPARLAGGGRRQTERSNFSDMTGAMYAAIAGLRTHMQNLNIIGNNVANVNTYGYKASRAVFKTSLYTTLNGGSNGTTSMGGTNPSQIGYGATVSSVDVDMGAGNYAVTGKPTDLMLDSDGFFLVGSKEIAGNFDGSVDDVNRLTALTLTRVGNFEFRADGYLAKEDGNCVYGFLCTGLATEADVTAGRAKKVGDALFSDQLVPIRYPRVQTVYRNEAGEIVPPNQDGTQPAGTTIGIDIAYPSATGNGHLLDAGYDPDLEDSPLAQARFQNISFDPNTGIITGTCKDTEEVVTIGCIAIGNVTNPNGVTNLGDNYYKAGKGSGSLTISVLGGNAANMHITQVNQSLQANDNTADGNGYVVGLTAYSDTGHIISSGLEMSTTDLAQEISQMILTQRGYQANTRIVTVTDSMLEELVNMKR